MILYEVINCLLIIVVLSVVILLNFEYLILGICAVLTIFSVPFIISYILTSLFY